MVQRSLQGGDCAACQALQQHIMILWDRIETLEWEK
jgi:hypothetical protein